MKRSQSLFLGDIKNAKEDLPGILPLIKKLYEQNRNDT